MGRILRLSAPFLLIACTISFDCLRRVGTYSCICPQPARANTMTKKTYRFISIPVSSRYIITFCPFDYPQPMIQVSPCGLRTNTRICPYTAQTIKRYGTDNQKVRRRQSKCTAHAIKRKGAPIRPLFIHSLPFSSPLGGWEGLPLRLGGAPSEVGRGPPLQKPSPAFAGLDNYHYFCNTFAKVTSR